MRTRNCRRALLRAVAIAAGVAASPAAAQGQGIAIQFGRMFENGGWTSYQLGWTRSLLGPLALGLGGTMVRGPGAAAPRLWGGVADVSLFRGGVPGPYAVGGVSGGFGTGTAERWWRSWSAGAGYELLPLPFLSLGVEGRYRDYAPTVRSGVELSVRIGAHFGAASGPARRGGPAPDTAPPTPGRSGAIPLSTIALSPAASGRVIARADARALLDGVVATADSAMGTRYRLGGRGADGDGFDCSGLIQYAYARHGIGLPRQSRDQAAQGREVGRALDALRAGDLLTFSSSGRAVTHVGLYVGGGRFIHSASGGVQTSRLRSDDPYGAWWYKRWVGARRIVE